jgi:transcriptional regulator with XRE-family HTH domain
VSEPTFHEKTFAEQMKRCREAKGMSQADLAKALTKRGLSYHQQTVLKVERGIRRVRLGEACTIADVLGVSLASLAGFGLVSSADLLGRIAELERAVTTARDVLSEVSS